MGAKPSFGRIRTAGSGRPPSQEIEDNKDMTQSIPWYKRSPDREPLEINPDRYPSIPAVLDDIAARYPDKVGYTNMDCGLTYSRTAALTKELAAYHQSLGL